MMHPAIPRLLTAVLLLLAAPGPVAAAQSAKWPSSSAPRPLAARDVAFPPYEVRTLPNGLQVVVVQHTEQPAVSLRLIVGAGPAQDPPATPGVAALVSALLDQGTASMAAQQVADTIDSVGGELETGVGRDLSFVHAIVMKDSLALAMNLVADVVRNPVFAPEELERQRRQTLSALRVSYQDPEYLANIVFDRLVYGFNPYGLPGNGTPASVAQITREHLVAFHRAYYAPNNCLLAVVGDLTPGEAMEAATRAFGGWTRHEVAAPAAPDPPDPARRVIVLDKPDAVQTEIRVGHLGIPRNNPDHMPVDLAIKILGGEGANRLHRVLRTERGLTYGASADTETLKRSGEFVAQTNTRSDATGEVLRLIVDEYSRLRRERVGDRELSDAKAYLTGHFPLTIETPDEIATQVLNALFYGLPLEELQTYRQRVNAVAVDDVERVANKYLRPDRLAVVLVGNASAFVDQLRGVGFGKFEIVPLADLDVSAASFRKADAAKGSSRAGTPRGGAMWPRGLPMPEGYTGLAGGGRLHPAQAPSSAVQQQPGPRGAAAPRPPAELSAEALIRRAVEAKGGLEALKAIRTVVATTLTTVNLPQGAARTQTTTYIQYPDRFRVEARVPKGTVVQVYAGDSNVWVQEPGGGPMDPPEAARKDFKASVQRDLIPLLVDAASGRLSVRLADVAPSDAADAVRALEVSGPDREPVRLFIDSATGLVVRESYSAPGGGTADELFSDYRPAGGIMVAYRAVVRRNNVAVLERAVTDFKVNVELSPGLFVRGSAGQQPPPSSRPSPLSSPAARPAPASPAGAPAAPPERQLPPAAPPASPATTAPSPAQTAPLSLAAPPAPAIPATDKEALALVEQAIAAKGGLARLKAIKTMRIDGRNVDLGEGRGARSETTSYVQYPDKYRMENRSSSGTAIAILDGSSFEVRIPGSGTVSPSPGSEVATIFRASIERDSLTLLLRLASGELKSQLFGPKVTRGEPRPQLLMVTGPTGFQPVVLGIDLASGMVTRTSYAMPPGSEEAWVDEVSSDFRDVNGIKVPFKTTISRMNTPIRNREIERVLIDSPLDPRLFGRLR